MNGISIPQAVNASSANIEIKVFMITPILINIYQFDTKVFDHIIFMNKKNNFSIHLFNILNIFSFFTKTCNYMVVAIILFCIFPDLATCLPDAMIGTTR